MKEIWEPEEPDVCGKAQHNIKLNYFEAAENTTHWSVQSGIAGHVLVCALLINSIWHYLQSPGLCSIDQFHLALLAMSMFVFWPERWKKPNEMILSCSDISVILCWILGYFYSSFFQPWALWSWQEKLEAKFWDGIGISVLVTT